MTQRAHGLWGSSTPIDDDVEITVGDDIVHYQGSSRWRNSGTAPNASSRRSYKQEANRFRGESPRLNRSHHDLADSARIEAQHVSEAVQYRTLDRAGR